MTTECKHGKFYTCKRLRMLEFLLNKGFQPTKTSPDPFNWKYVHWIFENSPELEIAVEEYFDQLNNK